MVNVNSHLSDPSTRQGSASGRGATFRSGLLAQLPRLRAFARSLARDPDRADDLVQETLAKAWAHRSQVQGRHEPESLALHNPAQHLLWGIAIPASRSIRQRRTTIRPSSPAHRRNFTTSSFRALPTPLKGCRRPARSTLPGWSFRTVLRRGGCDWWLCCRHDQEPRLPRKGNPARQVR